MGLDWRAYLKFVKARPLLAKLTELAHHSTLVQLLVLMIVLVPTERFVRLQQFVLADALGLCIALAKFTFWRRRRCGTNAISSISLVWQLLRGYRFTLPYG